jgi:hypothetical protein
VLLLQEAPVSMDPDMLPNAKLSSFVEEHKGYLGQTLEAGWFRPWAARLKQQKQQKEQKQQKQQKQQKDTKGGSDQVGCPHHDGAV